MPMNMTSLLRSQRFFNTTFLWWILFQFFFLKKIIGQAYVLIQVLNGPEFIFQFIDFIIQITQHLYACIFVIVQDFLLLEDYNIVMLQ